jgi:RNA polymerase sigma-70 factor (ECF subfamily)
MRLDSAKRSRSIQAPFGRRRDANADGAEDLAMPPDERPSFRRIYETTREFVKRSARRWGVDENDVDDLSQEVFLTIHRRLRDFQGRSSVNTWVAGILGGFVRNYRRSRRRKGPAEMSAHIDPDDVADTREDPATLATREEARRVLRRILDELSEEKAVLLTLAELDGIPVPEIARMLQANVDTVYSRLRIARRQFNVALDRLRGEDGEFAKLAELSPRALALLRTARSVDEPTDADTSRVRRSVLDRVAMSRSRDAAAT